MRTWPWFRTEMKGNAFRKNASFRRNGSKGVTEAAWNGTSTDATSVIRDVQKRLKTGEKTAFQLTKHQFEVLRARESKLGSFLILDEERALRRAKEIDDWIAQGRSVGTLAGVAVAIKDNIACSEMPTTAGSRILRDVRLPYNATVVNRLLEQGAIILGKTNMDEFGMGSTTENSGYQVSRNPWDVERVPGGSSGGSAAATAAHQCDVSLGSDTGGSIRQPASFCGVVGLKPSYGRVSRYGLLAYASSLDVVGPITRTVEDAAIVLNCIAGHDPMDSTSSSTPVDDYAKDLPTLLQRSDRPLAGKRLAVIKETIGDGVDVEVRDAFFRAVQHLEELGASVSEVSLSTFDAGLPAYYVLASSEASSNLARYDGVRYGPRPDNPVDLSDLYMRTRQAGFGAEVKRRILMGTYTLSSGYYDAYYKRAQKIRQLIYQELKGVLNAYDALLSPTAPTVAYKIGEKTGDPLSMYVGDIMTVNINLAGVPALSIPCGFSRAPQSLPIGMQIIGKMFDEAEILRLGYAFEQTADFARGSPPTMASYT